MEPSKLIPNIASESIITDRCDLWRCINIATKYCVCCSLEMALFRTFLYDMLLSARAVCDLLIQNALTTLVGVVVSIVFGARSWSKRIWFKSINSAARM